MPATARRMPSLDHWERLWTRIRCALTVDDPLLLKRYFVETQAMVHCGRLTAWHGAEASLRLLLATAEDRALPWHWRCLCLDNAFRPLDELSRLARQPGQRRRLQGYGRRLATCELGPSWEFSRA